MAVLMYIIVHDFRTDVKVEKNLGLPTVLQREDAPMSLKHEPQCFGLGPIGPKCSNESRGGRDRDMVPSAKIPG